MESFSGAQLELHQKSTESVRVLEDTTTTLDGSADMKLWGEALVKAFGSPKEPDIIDAYLPCCYTRVQQGDDLQNLLSVDLSVALAQRQQEKQPPPASVSSNTRQLPTFVKPTYAHAVARVLFDYPQNDPDDLPLTQGELIAILDMPSPQTGEESTWWVAGKFELSTGRLLQKGLIPSNYVTLDIS